MQKSVIEQIYFQSDKRDGVIANNELYQRLSEEARELYDAVENLLDEEGKNLLAKLSDAEASMQSQAAFINYREGIRMGFRLAMELTEQDET